jgi:hypothetical protein
LPETDAPRSGGGELLPLRARTIDDGEIRLGPVRVEPLETLREREADLAARLATHAHTPPDTATLVGLADQLDEIVANESPERAKELLRLLVKEIRVHDRRRIIPTYRIPAAVRAIPRKVDVMKGASCGPE